MLDTLLYVWIPPVCLGALMFGYSLYVLTPPYVMTPPVCLNAPLFLDTPCMFGCTHMFGHTPVCLDDVWMPPVHTQHKESMLCHTKGVSI